MIDRRYTPDELRAVISEAEALIGSRLDDLVKRYERSISSATPPKVHNPLIERLVLLRRAADEPNNEPVQNAALVAIAGVGAMLQIFREWRTDAAWPEFQTAIANPESYLHAVVTLSVGSALKEHHPDIELVPSNTPGSSPDLRMVVSKDAHVAIEVKTSIGLSNRAEPMTPREAYEHVYGALRQAGRGGQLTDETPGILVIGSSWMDSKTFMTLRSASIKVMAEHRRQQLLAIVISHTPLASLTVVAGRLQVGLEHHTTIESNLFYTGKLRLTGEWAGEWNLSASA